MYANGLKLPSVPSLDMILLEIDFDPATDIYNHDTSHDTGSEGLHECW